jgi:COMPASS component SWD3
MEEIKEIYRQLARQWHPDRFSDAIEKKNAEERFKQINGAYDYLKSHPPTYSKASTQKSPSPASVSKETNAIKSTPGELYEEAAALGKLGQYEAAIELLGLAIKLSPRYAKAYRYRGFIRSVLGFEMSAEADLRRAKAIEEGIHDPAKANSSSYSHRTKVTPTQAQTQTQTKPTAPPQPAARNPNAEPKSVRLNSVVPTGDNLQPWKQIAKLTTPQAQCVTFTKDHNTIVTGDRSGKISLWSLKTKQQYIQLDRHDQAITRLHLSTDGQILMSASRDGSVNLWHLSSATLMRTLKHDSGAVFAVWMSGDRRYVITGGEDRTLRVWQAKDGQLLQSFAQQASSLWAIAGNATGNAFATSLTQGELQVWNILGQQRPIEAGKTESSLQYPGSAIAFLRDPAVLICGNVTGVIRVWNEADWNHPRMPRYTIAAHEGMVRAIAVHPLGLQFATAGEDGIVRVWTGSEGRLVAVLTGHQGPVLDITWNRKGDRLASLGADGQVNLWQSPT